MTTPTGQISMSQIRLEIYGSATGSISLTDTNVRTLAGDPTGAVPMSDCKGKTWGGGGSVTFTPNGGTVEDDELYPNAASVTLNCSSAATWTYSVTQSSSGTSVSLSSGASGTSITFSLSASSTQAREASWSVTGVSGSTTKNFTVILTTTSLQ